MAPRVHTGYVAPRGAVEPANERETMLRSLKDLERYSVSASDGDIGSVANFLLDDERWVIRYLVVETEGFFDGRSVLVSPISFRTIDWSTQRFHLALTRDKVKHSPSIDTDKPVSRQHEWEYYQYYGYPFYWDYPGVWGMGTYPGPFAKGAPSFNEGNAPTDAHLRSVDEVRGYHIRGSDDAIGHVDDFIVDDETWEVRYLVVDTSNWWFGKKVLISPRWTNSISWTDRTVRVDLTREAIKNSPEWNPTAGVNRQYEIGLYDYYGRPVYWDGSERSAPVARLGKVEVPLR